jgi:hypothetical protein
LPDKSFPPLTLLLQFLLRLHLDPAKQAHDLIFEVLSRLIGRQAVIRRLNHRKLVLELLLLLVLTRGPLEFSEDIPVLADFILELT